MKRQKLGQHYLVDLAVVQKIVGMARVKPGERVLEIGTGRGALTRELVRATTRIEAFEVDPDNYRETLSAVGPGKVELHLADAFAASPRFDVLVSSLPYSESARFVLWLAGLDFDRAVVLLQEDFVEKIMAQPGARDYRAVSAIAQLSSEVKVLAKVGREAFSPRPKVSSLIVSFSPRKRVTGQEVANIVRLFSLRRREVRAALAKLGMSGRGGAYGHRRVYSLKPEEVHLLCSPGAP